MSLDTYFGDVKYNCYKDERGVYKDGQKVAVSNSEPSGYTRFDDGEIDLDPIDAKSGLYNVTTPMVFVGAVPGGDSTQVQRATIASLSSCTSQVQSITVSKETIRQSEGIELAKFTDVVLVLAKFTVTEAKIYDPTCTYTVCSC